MRGWLACLVLSGCFPGASGDDIDVHDPPPQCGGEASCSPQTPFGLQFTGTPLDDETDVPGGLIHPTAMGGTQNISFAIVDENDNALPFALPFTASAPDVTVLPHGPDSVDVTGVSLAEDELRIADPDHVLYGQIGIDVEDVQVAGLCHPAGGEPDCDADLVWAAAPLHVSIDLGDAGGIPTGVRIIDTAMDVDTGDLAATRPSWDALDLAAPAVGEHTITVRAGRLAPVPLTLTVVDHADAITGFAFRDPIHLQDDQLCVTLMAGAHAVAGAPWTVASDNGDAHMDAMDCIDFVPTAAGSVTLTASALGVTQAFTLAVM